MHASILVKHVGAKHKGLYIKALSCLLALLHIHKHHIQSLIDSQSPAVHDISTLIRVLIRYMLNPGYVLGRQWR